MGPVQPSRADTARLVSALGGATGQFEAYRALVALGAGALPAIRRGLGSDNWKIRYWCAICLDQVADAESLGDLVPLIADPHFKVRLWAVHSVACDHCKDDVRCPSDVIPLVFEHAQIDEHVPVRRMAVIMLGREFTDRRAVPVLERILRDAADRKLRLHAEWGLRRLRQAAG
jgi:HEAT repeat protein